jgi:hypothetical protein
MGEGLCNRLILILHALQSVGDSLPSRCSGGLQPPSIKRFDSSEMCSDVHLSWAQLAQHCPKSRMLSMLRCCAKPVVMRYAGMYETVQCRPGVEASRAATDACVFCSACIRRQPVDMQVQRYCTAPRRRRSDKKRTVRRECQALHAMLVLFQHAAGHNPRSCRSQTRMDTGPLPHPVARYYSHLEKRCRDLPDG